jgi:exodeoxyribonuclease V alpha subunit
MHLEDLMLKLKSYFLSNKQIIQISQKYGEKALEKIWENPYCLCDDFEGIGFLTADGIARDCKFAPNDDYRIRTAVLYSLREQTYSQGHVYLPYQILAQKTRETLEKGKIQGDVDKNDIVRVMMDMIQNKELVMENDSAIYLPFYHTCEIRAAQKLRALIQTQPRKFSIDLNKLIQQMEKKQKIRFAKQQKEAFLTLPKSNVIVITGGPGTGKTTIVKGIIDIYRANFPGCRVILAAPTGRAAKRMEEATKIPAKTIHRLLEFRPSGDKIVCGKDEHNPIEADVIIIDESSMIDVALLATFLKAVKPTTSLILVGDIDQLPSVGAGSVLKDIIECQKVPVVYLNEIFRQGETSNIVINARKVNSGDADLQLGEDFIFIKETDITAIARLVKQHYLVEIHRQGMPNLQELQIITPLRRKTETGVEQLNALLQETVNPKNPKKAELRYGSHTFRRYDKVMQYRNNYEKDIYNGDMGIIESVSAESNILLVRMESGLVEFTKDDLDELQLAYAMTIHKSQGCEYETVIIPLCMEHKRMLQRNLIYTAITRAKSKVILIGDPEALAYAVSNHCVNERFSKLAKRI